MTRITGRQASSAEKTDREDEVKQRIIQKVAKRMDELRTHGSVCAELNPDVIVVPSEQSLLFEPQNVRVAEWLSRRLGLNNLRVRDRIRVHPERNEALARELKAAGFEVIC